MRCSMLNIWYFSIQCQIVDKCIRCAIHVHAMKAILNQKLTVVEKELSWQDILSELSVNTPHRKLEHQIQDKVIHENK